MTIYTPAPWAIETDHDEIDGTVLIHGAADAPGLTPVALVFTIDAFQCVEDEDRDDLRVEYDGNAALIASAPELLEALEALVEAVAAERNAHDAFLHGQSLEQGEAWEDAVATLVMKENEARAVIVKAKEL